MMRKVLIALAAAGSALAVASPAAAQYYPAPPPPYGHAYGYNNYGHIRSLQARIDQLQYRIQRLDSRDRISEREARRLRDESRDIERRLRYSARRGLSPWEAQNIERRIARLEARIFRDVRDGRRWGRNDWSDRDGWRDRDRDGRNDRWEDDRGRDHD